MNVKIILMNVKSNKFLEMKGLSLIQMKPNLIMKKTVKQIRKKA